MQNPIVIQVSCTGFVHKHCLIFARTSERRRQTGCCGLTKSVRTGNSSHRSVRENSSDIVEFKDITGSQGGAAVRNVNRLLRGRRIGKTRGFHQSDQRIFQSIDRDPLRLVAIGSKRKNPEQNGRFYKIVLHHFPSEFRSLALSIKTHSKRIIFPIKVDSGLWKREGE